MQNGGKRPGAGRKKGSLSKKTLEESMLRDHMVKAFSARWEEIETTIIDLATKNKDIKAIQMIVENCIGRPKQEVAGAISLPQLDQLASDIRTILETKPAKK